MKKTSGLIGICFSLLIIIYSWNIRCGTIRDKSGDEILRIFNFNMAAGFALAMGVVGLVGSLIAFKFPRVSFFVLSTAVLFLLLNGIFSLYSISGYFSLVLVPSAVLIFLETKKKIYY